MDPRALATPRRSSRDRLERALWLGLLTADTTVWIAAAYKGVFGFIV